MDITEALKPLTESFVALTQEVSKLNTPDTSGCIKFWVEIVAAVATAGAAIAAAVSAYLARRTLKEMETQRNNAYKPDIVVEPSPIILSWGNFEAGEDPETVAMELKNIGIGVAKNITFAVNVDNCMRLVSILNKIGSEGSYMLSKKENNNLLLRCPNDDIFPYNLESDEKYYMLPNAEKTYKLDMSRIHVDLLRRISQNALANNLPVLLMNIPDLEVLVSFEDIQGVKYKKEISLSVEVPRINYDEKRGEALFLISTIKSNNVE